MEKLLLAMLLVGIILGATGIQVGNALFSDRSLSEGNEISTGEFDIRISKDGSRFYDDVKLFEFSNLKPGDSREFNFYIKNSGDISVSTLMLSFNVEDLENGKPTAAESLVDNTTDIGELSKNIVITKLSVTKEGQTYTLDQYIGKLLKEINGTSISLLKESLTPGEQLKVTIGFKLKEDAGNECQTDTARITLKHLRRAVSF
ncbi:CalY family protein [Thermococcus sp. M39]|uniref:CalY family protein n=1 Tax=Thermococcus sp. M39 TaxID=1638262 RepID=UPI001F0E22C7|nr:CalY family protein [Thermococcus sp. M39]